VLQAIDQFAKKRSYRKGIVRFITHKADAGEIADYRGKLKQSVDAFVVRLNFLFHL